MTVEIALQQGSQRELAALQWETEIPFKPFDLQKGFVTRVLLAAKDAGKSLTCAPSRKPADDSLLRCMLAGGQKPIPSGAIAVLSLKIPEGAPPATLRLRFLHIAGVTRDLKQANLGPAEAAVTIRGR